MAEQHFETLAIRSQMKRSEFQEHSAPVHMTSSYKFKDAEEMRALFADEQEGNIYSRYSNPNTTELIEKVCLLEGAEAGWATATGMAAVFTTLASLLSQGDHVLACRNVFGSTHQLFTNVLPRFGITCTYAEVGDPKEWESLVQENTRILYVETPSNPGLDLLDLNALGRFAKKKGLLLVVDNCFATPYLQRPLKHGAHLCIHSATKYIDGQGRSLGGLIVGNKDLVEKIEVFARHSGPAMSPFNAWILSKSLETLAIRMDRHCENALKLAQYLETRTDLEMVKYPGLPSHPQHRLAQKQMKNGGGLVVFEARGGIERGKCFLDALEMVSLSANLGDARTIATHPASTTHAKLQPLERRKAGVSDGLIRISVGLENHLDIIEDVQQALDRS